MASKRAKAPERVYVIINENGAPVFVDHRKDATEACLADGEVFHEYRLVTPTKKRAGRRRK